MFAPAEFEKLVTQIGKEFTLDGASNDSGDNSHVPGNFCSAEKRPFEETEVRGNHIFLNAPFDQLEVMLQH